MKNNSKNAFQNADLETSKSSKQVNNYCDIHLEQKEVGKRKGSALLYSKLHQNGRNKLKSANTTSSDLRDKIRQKRSHTSQEGDVKPSEKLVQRHYKSALKARYPGKDSGYGSNKSL